MCAVESSLLGSSFLVRSVAMFENNGRTNPHDNWCLAVKIYEVIGLPADTLSTCDLLLIFIALRIVNVEVLILQLDG